jgi:hypothetical protein
MKTDKTKNQIIAALAAGFVFAAGTQAAFAKTIVVHSGNTVHPQLYDSAGKPVNRLPARVLGGTPKKVVCGLGGRGNFCQVVK